MASGSQRKVTLNCVDCCATITNKLMYVPEIAWCLQILDERSALNGITNPFDNHSRLQAIIGKCRANNQVQLTWVMQGIWYHWRRGKIASLSINDIKGAPSTGNRGLANHLLCKHELKPAIMVKNHHNFPNSIAWWTNTVGSAANSYKSWFDAEESNDKSWRARRDLHESKWLNLFADVVSESYTTGPPRLQSRPARPQVMLCRCPFS